jgi:hypothetical protein
MFAKDLSNKIFLPPRRQDTKFNYNEHLFLCLGAVVAILSGLSGLGLFTLTLERRSKPAESSE